ncbi:MAG: endolytic transglycosylase MltG [Gammaproteobacteria bacterium]|nr:MAG: endolytic transglycosylase MltG [Gammaproteobacteria bacterium]
MTFSMVIAIAMVMAIVILWRQYQTFVRTPLNLPQDGMTYLLKKGTGLGSFSADLYRKKIISSLGYFRLLAQLQGQAKQLRAGEYFFASGLLPGQLLEMVTKGKVAQHSFTIIEGWNMATLLAAIGQRPDIEHTLENVDLASKKGLRHLAEIFNLPTEHPEGWFMPETYFFTLGMSDKQILQRATADMQSYLDKAWRHRDKGLLLKGPYEALILASLIEKETGQADERQKISGVFHLRMQKHMRLETDPSVIYGMGDEYDGNIRKRDLRKDTPYNTYTRHGLPPTPIAMPGKAAIQAALHPIMNGSLYFVAKGDGSHEFSKDLKSHLKAVRIYQLGKRHAH